MQSRTDVMGSIGFYTLSDARCLRVANDRKAPLARCEILLGARCNFRCPYCRHVGGPDADVSDVRRTLSLWIADGLQAVRFSGGEPTLWKELPEVVALAAQSIPRVAVSTNGSASWKFYQRLVDAGVNDFSVSLDACCAADGSKMAGGVDAWNTVVENIKNLAKLTYVTVGVVLTESNLGTLASTVDFARSLGVADIRPIPAAQYGDVISFGMAEPRGGFPILRWRMDRLRRGCPVRGIGSDDSTKCSLVLDDMAVVGGEHYPCIIYLREGGKPIGKVGPSMRAERREWFEAHRSDLDPICSRNCLDFCVAHNNRVAEMRITKNGE
jgi:hypothetical protein